MKRGQRKRVSTPGQQRWHHLFGAYNWRTDMLTWTTARRKNSESFITFLEHLLLECYATQKIVLIMDNASYHKSKASLAALSLFEDRVRVVWLPTYCPFLNPIERFWLHMKTLACANKLYKSIQDLIYGVERTMSHQNDLSCPDRFVFAKTFD